MNRNIERLAQIATKEKRLILGLMSGTSLDGLDLALCECDGSGLQTKISLLQFKTVAYHDAFRKKIRAVFAQKDAPLEMVCQLNTLLGIMHAQIINSTLREWQYENKAVDLIASHGQTIFHSPQASYGKNDEMNSTLQIGDGDQIAFHTGIITLSDFRQKHVAAGGEGAPLSVYGDFLLYSDSQEEVFMVNIGGISNFTYLPAGASFEKVITTDTGPGNTLMNEWCELKFSQPFDEAGQIAAQGTANPHLLNLMNENTFFQTALPASTGPETFSLNWLFKCLEATASSISNEDIMATLNLFTAETLIKAIEIFRRKETNTKLIFSGGGIHNHTLMQHISNVYTTLEKNVVIQYLDEADAKEAMLFAMLANEAVAGHPNESFGNGSKASPAVSFGKICMPG